MVMRPCSTISPPNHRMSRVLTVTSRLAVGMILDHSLNTLTRARYKLRLARSKR